MTKRLSEAPAVHGFIAVAEQVCDAIDNHDRLDVRAFFESLERLLPQLMACALDLPQIRRGGPEPPQRLKQHEMWRPLFDRLRGFLGARNRYRQSFDPTKKTEDDPMESSLADDLADIYCDLRRGLDPWKDADAATRREIIWQWRFDYESHFGEHLVDSLRTIYYSLAFLNLGRSTDPEE